MALSWNYGQSIIVLPSGVLMASASPEQIRILLWLASDLTLAERPMQLAKLAGCDRKAAEAAISFWISEGVLTGERTQPAEPKQTPVVQKSQVLQRADMLPTYSTAELADMMEKRASMRLLVNESQQLMGKMFNSHEVNILFGLVDDLGLDDQYIVTLLAYCKSVGKKTMRSVERFALQLFNEEIRTPEALETFLQAEKQRYLLEGKVRKMFGMKDRELIEKEKAMINRWSSYGYGEEIIRIAFELTVEFIGEASMKYADAIMERWNAAGLRTAEAIRQKLEQEKAEHVQKTAQREKKPRKTPTVRHENSIPVGQFGNSFDTDDFFEAALNRSFQNTEDKK